MRSCPPGFSGSLCIKVFVSFCECFGCGSIARRLCVVALTREPTPKATSFRGFRGKRLHLTANCYSLVAFSNDGKRNGARVVRLNDYDLVDYFFMFSLQALFAKDDLFLNLLEASAEEARTSVSIITQILSQPQAIPTLQPLTILRKNDKKITNQISEQLTKTTLSTLEREDVQALAAALYKIPKTVEKFAERYLTCASMLTGADFSRHAYLMEQATGHVVAMVKCLRSRVHLEEVKDLNSQLQQVEGDADKLMLELLKDLYSGKHPGLQVLALKDLYEMLEKIIDRCRDAGNVVTYIVLKNS